jgi:hypothetical protein
VDQYGYGCSIAERMRTEADAWVFLANSITLIVGEEHVGRETTLGRVGVCGGQLKCAEQIWCVHEPFFFLSPLVLLALVLLAAALGILMMIES